MTIRSTPDIPRDEQQEIVVPAEGLTQLLVDIFVYQGMFKKEAETAAARLIEADLRGIHSHGSRAIWRYLDAMDEGDIDPRAQILVERETPAIAVLDGGKGLGHVAATKAMEMAIQKAREVGTGTVAVKRGQHFGAASVYVLMAIEEGMIGYCTTNTGPATVAAYGSRQPAVANNAVAWGIPSRTGTPFVLDMACAVSAWGKVESLKMYGGKLPEGWALDENGDPTTDPNAAKTLLPFAGARGYGMAFLSSVLAGPLVGGRTPIHKTWSVAADGSEHFFQAIDIQQFVDLDIFYKELDSSMADIRALEPAEGFDKVRLPGELEFERSIEWRENGIPIHRDHAAKLKELADKRKLAVPWETTKE
ncbi:MAG: ureidoglycolate dehydrogenase [Planctomycetaceae bacterium]